MENNQFSGPVSVLQENRLPEMALPVGYAALIDAYELQVPTPLTLSAIGKRHKVYTENGWRIYTPRHEPRATFEGHLVFALKYEGLDLAVLKRLFEAVSPADVEAIIRAKPTSAYIRRIWFLYEWLLERELDLPDAKSGTYADIVDRKQQWAVKGETFRRHRVRNNLPGTRSFCPLVWRTEKLERFVEAKLDEQARAVVGKISANILARTAAFLLLKDSKSSYAIEGEAPPHSRIQRWGKAIGEAGKHPLDQNEFLRLQRIVIGNERFIRLGFRDEGGFVGDHEQDTRIPLPDHISARHEDLPALVQGIIDFDQGYAEGINPVIAAAVLAFGFVYIHPFADGNGRLHRYLIHHVLTMRGFNPTGIVFPVSSAILERIDDYRRVLESYSERLLPFVEWEPTEKMNVRVLNDTSDFYKYFDATLHAEFLFECVQKTIEIDLPEEAAFLVRYDQFKSRVEALVEMPASTIDLLFNFLKQNGGQLSRRARNNEFAELTEGEVAQLEVIYQESIVR
ncbi:Fic family protein [Pseudohalocynthiibacter aestuariivivens]|uniref:Fic family protein n=1 Tax=Pseudohalocynthiibacter aestuariivivens TaxID=1591409 RepID=A0ABV5JGZ4_9RHOB|nr:MULTISPECIES: Fic family protein [Pseudohalocynthiibacter]MBS9718220.1 Fic family protein [Pseudohalocynthiibacter aestuariivivens]MCK0103867.1 Fic family protein [Pseudohalocynthiibacter sp. F2068]